MSGTNPLLELQVVVLERMAEAGRKILISGGTRWCETSRLTSAPSVCKECFTIRLQQPAMITVLGHSLPDNYLLWVQG